MSGSPTVDPARTGSESRPVSAFGRHMLEHWALDPAITYLNHGTVGAPPRRVLAAQQAIRDEIERQPSRFLLRELAGSRRQCRAASRRACGRGRGGRRIPRRPRRRPGVRGQRDDRRQRGAALPGTRARRRDPGHRPRLRRDGQRRGLCRARARGAGPNGGAALSAPRSGRGRRADRPAAIGPTDPARRSSTTSPPRARSSCRSRRSSRPAARAECRVLVDGAHAPGAIPLDIPSLGVDWYPATSTSGPTRRAAAGSSGPLPSGRRTSIRR